MYTINCINSIYYARCIPLGPGYPTHLLFTFSRTMSRFTCDLKSPDLCGNGARRVYITIIIITITVRKATRVGQKLPLSDGKVGIQFKVGL